MKGADGEALRDDVRDEAGNIRKRNGGKVISTLVQLAVRQRARKKAILKMIGAVTDQLHGLEGSR